MRLVTFVIPTVGRESLSRAINSLSCQTDPYWNALVIADGVEGFVLPRMDDRVYGMNLMTKQGHDNCSGMVRNHGLTNACGEWIGFVDDDDSLDQHYVEWLRAEGGDADVVIFKMQVGPGGPLLPSGPGIVCGDVGISFAVRRSFQWNKGIWFCNSQTEDFLFLSSCLSMGARVRYSERTVYRIRH